MAIPRNLANIAPHVNASSTELVVNDGGANLDFRVESDTSANTFFLEGSSGNVGIGTNSPNISEGASGSTVLTISATASARNGIIELKGTRVSNGQVVSYIRTFNNSGATPITDIQSFRGADDTSGTLAFSTSNTERMRILANGDVGIGKAASNINLAGTFIGSGGAMEVVRDSNTPFFVSRLTNDGNLVDFYQGGSVEGSISVSGSTVSYNAFSGGHWSQLQEGRGYNPDIPRGTVMSTIGEMCEWKSVEWTETTEHEATEEKEAWTETSDKREAYLGDLLVGATFEEDGFTKTVVGDGNERLPKVKISDVVGDKTVYGVFQTWDDVEDMLVTSLGAFVVRIAAGVTVEIGDLLESNGDGCAKVQDDDVIRSKTIAKVTSTIPTDTYADGSYTVPAVIYCG